MTLKNNMPLVSVVIPVYNAENYIAETLDCLQRQTYSNLEIICVNDGSTDASLNILNQIHNDFNFQIISQENKGPGAARNMGLDAAQGDFVAFLDADDKYEPMLIEKLVCAATKTKYTVAEKSKANYKQNWADVTICKAINIDSSTEKQVYDSDNIKSKLLPKSESFTPKEINKTLFSAIMGWPWDKLFKRTFLVNNQLKFPNLHNSEDAAFVYPALALANRIALVKEPLIQHRIHPKESEESVSTSRINFPEDFYESIIAVKQKLLETGVYSTFEYTFLNWALDWTLWNINTLPKGVTRTTLINNLFESKYSTLELNNHDITYYNLFPSDFYYFELLKAEYEHREPSITLRDKAKIGRNKIAEYGIVESALRILKQH